MAPNEQVATTNAGFNRLILGFGAFCAALAVALPESSSLPSRDWVRFLARFVPSAGKAASVSAIPEVVLLFVTFTFWMAPLLAGLSIGWREPLAARVAHARLKEPSALKLVVRCALALLFFGGLLAFLYILPGTVSATPSMSRGQGFFSLMVRSRAGLLVTGPALAAGALCLWWFCLLTTVVATGVLVSPRGRSRAP